MGVPPIALESVVGIAELEAEAGRHESAGELLGLVLAHPALHDETLKYADPAVDRLREHVPEDQLESALSRGAGMELSLVVDRLCYERDAG